MARRKSEKEQLAALEKKKAEQLQTICGLLNRLAVKTVDVSYNGYGDEGEIEGVKCIPNPPAGLPEGFESLIEEYAHSTLPPGWEIEAGSQGVLQINVARQTTKLNHEWRLDEDLDDYL
jgi:hypothetical protein